MRRVLPGILPLAMAFCSAARIEACDKDKATTCTNTTPVAGEPDVGAIATAPVPTVTILELMSQHSATDTRVRAIDPQASARWVVPKATTTKPARGAQAGATAAARVTPAPQGPQGPKGRSDAGRPADRAPAASGTSGARPGAGPDRQVSRPHRMPSPEIL
jgi:hypothetical protein